MTATTLPRPPAGFTKVGTGWFEPAHVPVAMSTGRPRRLLAHDGTRWLAVAPIVGADARTFTVACPTCPPPRLRRRKQPRRLHEVTATHVHGRSSEGAVQHRAAHHAPGPDYLILDVYGVLSQTARP